MTQRTVRTASAARLARASRAALRRRLHGLRRAVRGPGRERDVLVQMLKTVLAAVLSYEVALRLLDSPAPFFAPLAAVVAVRVTVYESVWRGVRTVAAVLLGVLLAFAVAHLLGLNAVSIAVVLVVALALGRSQRLGTEGVQVPVTALLMLAIAGPTKEFLFVQRVVETAVGIAVAVALNLLVAPPVHLGSARSALRDVAEEVRDLLRTMAAALRSDGLTEEVRDWMRQARSIDRLVSAAEEAVDRARESLRLNPRRSVALRGLPLSTYEEALVAFQHVRIQLRGISRTLLEVWDEHGDRVPNPFLTGYAELLDRTADAVEVFAHFDPTRTAGQRAQVERIVASAHGDRAALESRLLHDPDVDRAFWAVRGSLLLDADRMVGEFREHLPGS